MALGISGLKGILWPGSELGYGVGSASSANLLLEMQSGGVGDSEDGMMSLSHKGMEWTHPAL